MIEHLLKDGSYLITLCGIDSEYIDGMICHFKMNESVNCKRCICVLQGKIKKEKQIKRGNYECEKY